MKNPPDFPSHLPKLPEPPAGRIPVFRGVGGEPEYNGHWYAWDPIDGGDKWYLCEPHQDKNSRAYFFEFVPLPSPELDYNSPHYRAWVEAAFAGGLRVEQGNHDRTQWLVCGHPEKHGFIRIHPEDADKEPDYSALDYRKRIVTAQMDGIPIQFRNREFWEDTNSLAQSMFYQGYAVRIAPPIAPKPDPYAELKAKEAAGKIIQVLWEGREWRDLTTPATWDCEPECYRVKPKMVPLGPGDLPSICWLRLREWGEGCGNLVQSVEPSMVILPSDLVKSYQNLMDEGWLYSADRKTWTKCEKEAA